MSDGPYLFDVSLVALAHAGTPVSAPALGHVRRAVHGSIDAVVPHSVLLGAHHTLRNVYRFSNEEASRLLARFRDARRIHWFEDGSEAVLREGFDLSGSQNIDGWDGYYAAIARQEGVETVLTLDDDFQRVDGLTCDVILDADQFRVLNEYIEDLAGE